MRIPRYLVATGAEINTGTQRIKRRRYIIEPETKLVSPPPDTEGMKRRVDDALLKEMLGEPLCERELNIAQWFRNGGGCASCAAVRRRPDIRTNIRKEDIYYRRIPVRV